jgi:hypothetical protein
MMVMIIIIIIIETVTLGGVCNSFVVSSETAVAWY